jgi:hypothetical protein
MSDTPKDDEAKFNETLKRMLATPPKPHKPKPKKKAPAKKRPAKSAKRADS